jgi:tetratricopeptide (TPR) repeat protein
LHDLGIACVYRGLIPEPNEKCRFFDHVNSIHGHDVSSLDRSDYAIQHFRKGPVGSVAEISYSWQSFYRQALRQVHGAVLYARKGDMAKAQEIYISAASHIDDRCLPAVKEKDAFLALMQPIVNTHLATAKQLETQGKYAESLPEYAQVLSFAANEQEASTLRAAMFAASGKMPTPPEMPDDAHRHVVRGELLLNQGMMDRALLEFNEALRMAPYMPKLYYNTALICGELKQYDQAIRQMHLYLTVAPEALDARAAQDQITKWELQQEMGGKR